jgi:hypothetical protein
MMPTITLGSIQEWQHSACMLLPFLMKIDGQLVRHPTQMEQFEFNVFMQMPQHCWFYNIQSLSYRTGCFKWRFVQNRQNFGIKIVQRKSSAANFIMQVLTAAPYLGNPESYPSKLVGMFAELCL